MLGYNFAYNGRIFSKRMVFKLEKHIVSGRSIHHHQHLAFVGHIQRIEAKQFTNSPNTFFHRNLVFYKFDAEFLIFAQFGNHGG